MTQLPLFMFPPGARGDFLFGILYGDALEKAWTNPMVKDNGVDYSTGDKIHNFGISAYNELHITPENLSDWTTYWIKISTPESMWDVAWLNYSKHPQGEALTHTVVNSRYCLTKMINQEFACYQAVYNNVINYEDLWSIEYLKKLYQQVNNKDLSPEQLDRIQHNININLDLIKQNPFELVDDHK